MVSDITAIGNSTLPPDYVVPERVEAPRPADLAAERQTVAISRQGQAEEPAAAPDRAKLEEAVAAVQHQVQSLHTAIEFSIDDQCGQLVVKIIDTENRETIRQIPPDQALALAKFFRDLEAAEGKGLTVNKLKRGSAEGRSWIEGLLIHVRV
jgi:flagellar protein FlaG